MAGHRASNDERLRKQREYQKQYRKRLKGARAPDRDEIARELLHYAITENLKNDREAAMWRLAEAIIDRLVERGYDADATEQAFTAIVDRYEAGWSFQRRLHLLPAPDDLEDEGSVRH